MYSHNFMEVGECKSADEDVPNVLEGGHQSVPIHGLAGMVILPEGLVQWYAMGHIQGVLELLVLVKVQQ